MSRSSANHRHSNLIYLPTKPTNQGVPMTLEYEVHNFDMNEEPRYFEAVYSDGEGLVVKAALRQRNTHRGSKPILKWGAGAFAWTPGQSDDGWTSLAHLTGSEITVREVIAYEANVEDWLTAARYDVEKLMERAQPFATVLSKAMASQGGKRRGLKTAA